METQSNGEFVCMNKVYIAVRKSRAQRGDSFDLAQAMAGIPPQPRQGKMELREDPICQPKSLDGREHPRPSPAGQTPEVLSRLTETGPLQALKAPAPHCQSPTAHTRPASPIAVEAMYSKLSNVYMAPVSSVEEWPLSTSGSMSSALPPSTAPAAILPTEKQGCPKKDSAAG